MATSDPCSGFTDNKIYVHRISYFYHVFNKSSIVGGHLGNGGHFYDAPIGSVTLGTNNLCLDI